MSFNPKKVVIDSPGGEELVLAIEDTAVRLNRDEVILLAQKLNKLVADTCLLPGQEAIYPAYEFGSDIAKAKNVKPNPWWPARQRY